MLTRLDDHSEKMLDKKKCSCGAHACGVIQVKLKCHPLVFEPLKKSSGHKYWTVIRIAFHSYPSSRSVMLMAALLLRDDAGGRYDLNSSF